MYSQNRWNLLCKCAKNLTPEIKASASFMGVKVKVHKRLKLFTNKKRLVLIRPNVKKININCYWSEVQVFVYRQELRKKSSHFHIHMDTAAFILHNYLYQLLKLFNWKSIALSTKHWPSVGLKTTCKKFSFYLLQPCFKRTAGECLIQIRWSKYFILYCFYRG